ncbi:hypothetical protein [Lelliottia aquatilis]|uniref:hypothetical protein n=1 Tax=Lelliottia aquatilis TaxID=2080838 RepID=UPI001056FD54|nr:hypothetical protein [Lelliottia aquatilis]
MSVNPWRFKYQPESIGSERTNSASSQNISGRCFGLGMTQGGNAIGVWNVVFHSSQVDGVSTQTSVANNGIVDFADTAPTMRNNGKVTTWIQNNAIASGEIFTIQADAAVTIAPLEDLPSGSKISFAGSATLEIIFL